MARIRKSPKVGGGKTTGYFVVGLHRRHDKIDVLWDCEDMREAQQQARMFREHLDDYQSVWIERVRERKDTEISQGTLFDC